MMDPYWAEKMRGRPCEDGCNPTLGLACSPECEVTIPLGGEVVSTTLEVCPTCTYPHRETVGMVCPTCGIDYAAEPQESVGTEGSINLTEFLLARIAEDEADVAGVDGVNWTRARVLAECEAKRRIVDEHPDYGGYGQSCATCAESETDLTPWPCPTLRYLAAVYADHPDYREEWKP